MSALAHEEDALRLPTLQEVMEENPTTPVIPDLYQESEESQDPLATVPPMKKYLLEQRVSAPSTTVETPAPIETKTTTSCEEMTCELRLKRFIPTANKLLGEMVWLLMGFGKPGKTFTDVTLVCASIWETSGQFRRFAPVISVAMLNDDLIGVCYMTEMYITMVKGGKEPQKYETWLEEVSASRPTTPKTTLIAGVIEHARKAVELNYRMFTDGIMCAAFQRRYVRRLTDVVGGMRNNFNVCLSSSTPQRFTYAILRTVIA